MIRKPIFAAVAVSLVLLSCRSDTAFPTTTSTTRGPLGMVIAACRLGDDTVTLLNQANSARNLNGWVIHDAGREHVLDIGFVLIDHARTMVFMSGPDAQQEANTRGEIWWSPDDVWDDDGDTAYLVNPAGELVDERACTG